MILIDPPAWPAHGTLWSHLVSDASLEELHTFAAGLGAPRRGFDLDHYDLPATRYDDALAAGAAPVGGGELVRRLVGSGLRVPGRDRALLKDLRRRWLTLRPEDHATGDELLLRWREPHRAYHGPRHLTECLDALDLLLAPAGDGAPPPPEAHPRGEPERLTAGLALWFHDAVHTGRTPEDEEASAGLALSLLHRPPTPGDSAVIEAAPGWSGGDAPEAEGRDGDRPGTGDPAVAPSRGGEEPGAPRLAVSSGTAAAPPDADPKQPDPERIAGLVRMTARHDPAPGDRVGALVSDADLAILAAAPDRYDEYARQVRAEYAQVAEQDFRAGRRAALDGLLHGGPLYRTDHARRHWTDLAVANLRRELSSLAAPRPRGPGPTVWP